MLEFNLLPDVKRNYIKAQKYKLVVVAISIVVSVISVTTLTLLIVYINVIQKNSIKSLTKDINSKITVINQNTNLNKILTIQKQASVIPNIQSQLYQSSRVFNYMAQLTPSNAKISNISVDFSKSSININGTADSLATVNQFVDTLKFTTYTSSEKNLGTAFSGVILNSFSYSSGSSPSYSLTFSFKSDIFMQKKAIALVVPSITSTRSILGQPNDLFQKVK